MSYDYDAETDCWRCLGSGMIFVGSWGQRAETCPDCKGTGKHDGA